MRQGDVNHYLATIWRINNLKYRGRHSNSGKPATRRNPIFVGARNAASMSQRAVRYGFRDLQAPRYSMRNSLENLVTLLNGRFAMCAIYREIVEAGRREMTSRRL